MWTFKVTAGTILNPEGALVTSHAYAGGNCGKNPEGVNNPAKVMVKDIGPLPPGLYTMGTPVEHSRLGPFAIPLTPDPANVMYGRGGFFCHGDTVPSGNASEGCIIAARFVRDQMWASADHQIQVVI